MFVCLYQRMRISAQWKARARRFVEQRHRLGAAALLPVGDVHRHEWDAFAPVQPGKVQQSHGPAANPAILRGRSFAFQVRGHGQVGRIAATEALGQLQSDRQVAEQP